MDPCERCETVGGPQAAGKSKKKVLEKRCGPTAEQENRFGGVLAKEGGRRSRTMPAPATKKKGAISGLLGGGHKPGVAGDTSHERFFRPQRGNDLYDYYQDRGGRGFLDEGLSISRDKN